VLGLATGTGCVSVPAHGPAETEAAFRRAMGQWIAADGPAAITTLRTLSPQALDDERRTQRECMLARFADRTAGTPSAGAMSAVTPSPATPPAAGPHVEGELPPPVAAVLRAYRDYWTTTLMRRTSAEEAEPALARALVAAGAPPSRDLPAQTKAALALVCGHGLHAWGGVTPPLHEFMLWRRQGVHAETVALPDGTIEVPVTRLEGFVSLGWLAYATCDRHHTGGWATANGLMVVTSAWDLSSEAYRVSLLAHEAQHFADLRRFPKLEAADLEFRAKLVELVLAERTQQELVEAFGAQARRGRASPHAHASHSLLVRLRARLGRADLAAAAPPVVRAAALAELRAHTQALQARGAAEVRTALTD
jgi:hypothetical protein